MVYAIAAYAALNGGLGIVDFVFAGGAALVLFTFGFGGIPTLSKMFGALLFLSCASELLICLMGKVEQREEGI